MKTIARMLLVGALAMGAFAVSVAPSDAAKRKSHKMAAGCLEATTCAANCVSGSCQMMVCGMDKKWYPAFFTPVCLGGSCPKACPK